MSNDPQSLVYVKRNNLNFFYENVLEILQTFYSVKFIESDQSSQIENSSKQDEYVSFRIESENPDSQIDVHELVSRIQKDIEWRVGGATEASEDSSYDSDHSVEEGSHRAASRTASDTLAAEFAEYVSVGYTTRLEFALKLGYSERLVQAALHRLGPEPAQNELLAELIKLGAQQARAPEQGLADAPPVAEPPAAHALRPIVVDGSNVAMSHGNKEVFSCRGIKICVEWFRARGHKDITVFVPKWRKEASRPDNRIAARELLDELERERVLVYTPSRLVGGKRLVCYDDRYVLRLAAETDGVVVSNDNYRDLAQESPEFRRVVDERLLMYSFVNDRFMPPDDPLGRSGPTLDRFLRSPRAQADAPPPCPYGRKCTYGNKCKFHHPERGSQPHKSVTEWLSERAARAMRARRDLHTLSLPPRGSDARKAPLARAASAEAAAPAQPHRPAWCYAPLPPGGERTEPEPPDGANPHRKLQRQLTLNPVCDPRLRAWPHAAAARVASAPDAGAGAPVGGRYSSPCASEPALPAWEARRRMHYHLAGIFPEAQVLEVMAAHPDETDAQKICAIILNNYHRT